MSFRYLFSFLFFISFWTWQINGQSAWTWEVLDSMPEHVANNAVAYGEDEENRYVFSFGGIDTTKIYSGIHKKAFRYNILDDYWDEIEPLPFELSNIASGASTVNNLIYIIGGYHVYAGGGEVSSNEVIRYDPSTNSYLTNGSPIPTPIDDHVQCVWRDSLIFVITGWSNTENVPDVQIYNPELDEWTTGTPTPNTNNFKAFGASGEIIGDTIYYYGGASMGIDFPARKILRKGVINAVDPTLINWTLLEDGPNNLYRSAALTFGTNVFWLGGSEISYNYNGVAYNGSGGVPALAQIMRYNHLSGNWNVESTPYGIMDLRGIAQVSPTQWIVCGGMEVDQKVSSQTYLLTYDPVIGVVNEIATQHEINLSGRKIIVSNAAKSIQIYTTDGRLLANLSTGSPFIPDHLSGKLIIKVTFEEGWRSKKVIL